MALFASICFQLSIKRCIILQAYEIIKEILMTRKRSVDCVELIAINWSEHTLRPSSTCSCCVARSTASLLTKETKPNPRDRPLNLSRIIITSLISPNCSKYALRLSVHRILECGIVSLAHLNKINLSITAKLANTRMVTQYYLP